MNIERVKLLIEALRSGQYEQTTGCLNNGSQFCVAGVMCDVYRKKNKKGKWISEATNFLGERWSYMGDMYGMTFRIEKWFGISGDYSDILMKWNDDQGLTFDQIADRLEQEVALAANQ